MFSRNMLSPLPSSGLREEPYEENSSRYRILRSCSRAKGKAMGVV
jgi:hypothetical protein